MDMKRKRRIAIFASGSGTNAQNIIEYFSEKNSIIVDSIFTNRGDAYVITRAERFNIPWFLINRESFYSGNDYVRILEERKIDLIVLAGFLWLVPEILITKFRIINIHPALLPKYGGKGMYGMRVHEAVVNNGEKKSGITIHYVNEAYDEGKIIFQAECMVTEDDTPESVAQKVHELEYQYFPEVIEKVVTGKV